MPAIWRSFNRQSAAVVLAVASVGILTTASFADINPPPPGTPAPAFFMTWDNDGESSTTPDTYNANTYATTATEWGTWNLGGTQAPNSPDGVYLDGAPRTRTGWRYRGDNSNSLWSFSWDCTINEDPFVDATINVQNNSNVTQTFWVYMPLNIVPAITPNTSMSGSVSAVVSDGNPFSGPGVTMATNGVDSVYTAFIDPAVIGDPGAIVRTQWNAPAFSLTAPAFGANNANANFASEIGPGANTSIAIRLRFTLSPGDSASVTGLFDIQPVPGPAGLPLLALFAIAGRRRRS
jgi:MYXO-CTERM domain-containing protein